MLFYAILKKKHLQPQTTPCLTTFDPGPCDRSALVSAPDSSLPTPISLDGFQSSALLIIPSAPASSADPDCVEPPVTHPPAAQVAVCQPAAVFFGDKHQMLRGRWGSDAGLAEMDLADLGSQHCATPHSVQRSRCRLENQESLVGSEALISTLHVTAVGLWSAVGGWL